MVEWNRVLISFGSYSVVWLRGTGVLISFGSYSVVWLSGTGFSSRSVRILSCGLEEQGSHLVRFVLCRVVEWNRVLISFDSYSVVWLSGTGFSSHSIRILSCG